MKRRSFIQGSAAAAAVMFIEPTWLSAATRFKQDFSLEQRLEPILALGKPQKARIGFNPPEVAEDGSVVPIEFEVDSPMTHDDYIKKIWVLADKNPDPLLFTINLSPEVGITHFETRIRMAEAANVRVYVQDSKGNMYESIKWIEATAGCG